MADLKNDLLNKLTNDKMYEELELIRLSEDPNMNYREKIYSIDLVLGNIAMINAKIGGVQQYYTPPQVQQPVSPEPNTVTPPVAGQAPMQIVHQGQTHGE